VLYVYPPVVLWKNGANEYIKGELPSLEVVEIDPGQPLESQIKPGTVGILLCEAKTKEQFDELYQLIRILKGRISSKDLAISVVTLPGGNEAVNLLEKNGVVQVIPPNAPPKALKLKLELLFSKTRSMKQSLAEKEEIEYLFRVQRERGAGSNTISLQPKRSRELQLRMSSSEGKLVAQPIEIEGQLTSLPVPRAADNQLVLISPRDRDLVFAAEIARRTHSTLHYFYQPDSEFEQFLAAHPGATVLWDIDHEDAAYSRNHQSVEHVGMTLSRFTLPQQVFAISNENINRLPYIFNYQKHVFSHCMFRGENPSALGMYSRLVTRMRSKDPFGIKEYFGEDARHQEILITRTAHRLAAVSATETFLLKSGLIPRLATQAARATDELILNAMYDAPVDGAGKHYRKSTERPNEQEFNERENVSLAVYQNDDYYAISVADRFGSLQVSQVLKNLQKNFSEEKLGDNSEGIGLNSVIAAGFSLMVAVKPSSLSEISLFFPNARNYRSFRRTFQFLSILSWGEWRSRAGKG
jgi:hypothetical protein